MRSRIWEKQPAAASKPKARALLPSTKLHVLRAKSKKVVLKENHVPKGLARLALRLRKHVPGDSVLTKDILESCLATTDINAAFEAARRYKTHPVAGQKT